MATARDKALAEIAKLPPEARKYLTALAKKSNAMNQRSMGSGEEYVKGQVRASQGKPKRVQKAASKSASKPASKPAAKPASKPAAKPAAAMNGSWIERAARQNAARRGTKRNAGRPRG